MLAVVTYASRRQDCTVVQRVVFQVTHAVRLVPVRIV